jgi:peptidoglycan/LPS O-acetylase OafA/YrhL
LGEASFAFYMIHYWVVYFLRNTLLTDYTNPLVLLNLVAVLLLATGLSILVYYLVETPCRKFIVSRFSTKKSEPVTTTFANAKEFLN